MNMRSFWLSALIAGAVLGLLGNLPVLNLINCVLCVFVWLGGALAVYLYRRYEKGVMILSTGQAAGLGAVAGVIGALVGALVFMITSSISAPIFNALAQFVQYQGAPPFRSGIGGLLISTTFFFCLDVILYPIFGALGAMIGASMMKKPVAVA